MSKARQILAIVAWLSGVPSRRSRSASSRDNQSVIPNSAGGSVNVNVNTRSRTSGGTVGGLSDRGASARPGRPRSAN